MTTQTNIYLKVNVILISYQLSEWNISGIWKEKKVPMNELKKSFENIIKLKIGQTEVSVVESVNGQDHSYLSRGQIKNGIQFENSIYIRRLKINQIYDDEDRDYAFEVVSNEIHLRTKEFVEVFKN